MKLRVACLLIGFLCLVLPLAAQTSSSRAASAQVPPLIQFSNVGVDEGGNSLTGAVNITFTLYASQQGGQPLWTETQRNVSLDTTGHYSVQLGVTTSNDLPTALFTAGQARWLGMRGKIITLERNRTGCQRDSDAWLGNFPLSALPRLGFGRARARSGGAGGARTAYQDSFAPGKMPTILKQTKAEYAKLR